MTQQRIYHLNEQGSLEPMQEADFDLEVTLQELVAKHLDLLSGEQITPVVPRRWILIGREQGIPAIEGGSSHWALDHLLIDQDAIPTLVETKLAGNPDIRRAVVGQMLEYAAHARRTWNVERIRRAFEERAMDDGLNPDEVLAELLQPEDELDVESFWQRVETNLRAANLRLLFVADAIPDSLTRVVEFLNEQMPNIQVLAVEIKQFLGATGRTLVPRVIGRTSEAATAPGRQSGLSADLKEQTFLDSFDGGVRPAAERLLEVVRQHNARCIWLKDAVNINFQCISPKENIRIARLCVPGVTGVKGWDVAEGFFLGINEDKARLGKVPPSLQEVLEKWHNEFSKDEFAKPISGLECKAYVISHQDAAANINTLAERLDRVLGELRDLPPNS